MMLIGKLKQRFSRIRTFRLRKSRKVGILVERKVMQDQEQEIKEQTTQSSYKLQKFNSLLDLNVCDNLENNIVCVWKCDKNNDVVRVIKFKKIIFLKHRSSNSHSPISFRNSSRTPPISMTLKGKKRGPNLKSSNIFEKNHNHSARENDALPVEESDSLSMPRTMSEEKYDTPKSYQYQRPLISDKQEKFLKYIPVNSDYQLIRKNDKKVNESSWVEIDAWCSKYQRKRQLTCPEVRKSDTLLIGRKDKTRFSIYRDVLDVDTKDKSISFDDNMLINHPRLGYFSNMEYLGVLLKSQTQRIRFKSPQDKVKKNLVEFCISPETLSFSPQLCHQKTEIILNCLRVYFKNLADIEVMWVDKLDRHLPRKSMINYFPLTVASILDDQLRNCRAVMYVTKDVSVMLRHPDTCFLSTLCFSAGIKRHELVILPLDTKPKHLRK
ncbi:hypothetical protein SNE40_010247 [Patella caerulea]|uniref:Uncharacterized protein n=1 Tax=Patella caerulea TaxID=87958 RepID=A0AAN8K0K9_PATCE